MKGTGSGVSRDRIPNRVIELGPNAPSELDWQEAVKSVGVSKARSGKGHTIRELRAMFGWPDKKTRDFVAEMIVSGKVSRVPGGKDHTTIDGRTIIVPAYVLSKGLRSGRIKK